MAPWLTWTIVALLSWGGWAVLSKMLGDALTPGQSQALSTLGTLPILLALARPGCRALKMATARGIVLTIAGGIVTCLGNLAYYAALAGGERVATVVPLTALYPLTTIALAVVLRRERLSGIQLAGLALSFAAIWLFDVKGDGHIFSRVIVYALPPILLWGLSGYLQKVATDHLPASAAALLYLGAFVPVAVLLAIHEPRPAPLSGQNWILVLSLGFLLAFGNFAVLAAFARGGQASIITPLGGIYPLVSVPIAVALLGERISRREIAGIVCALISVVALSIEPAARPNSESPTPNKLSNPS